MAKYEVILRTPLSPTDTKWVFTSPELKDHAKKSGKHISFTAQEMKLRYEQLPSNRIIHNDDPTCFVVVAFENLRFPEPATLGTTRDYIRNFLTAGLTLNGVHYRFYHHSNSQLRGRSCFLRAAATDAELDERIYALGSFKSIMNIAKRAKRIGLLFSGAEIDYKLEPRFTQDIPDIMIDSELFSDGCGLMSRNLAKSVSREKEIIIRGKRYMPSVFQIRYRSYKGVLMVHPPLDRTPTVDAQFRGSMKKFTATNKDTTLSVVDFSRPYAFGRLNSDIVVLMSALGVTDERLITKQAEYFKLLEDATSDPEAAINLLSVTGKHDMVERLLLDGFDSTNVQNAVRASQDSEIKAFLKEGRNDTKKERVRMILPKSRLLFGVCDPSTGPPETKYLKPGQVHVRITTREGVRSLHEIDVMVIRNPCLHPGDLLKLRAVAHPKLDHLVDCVVFASHGRRAAPSMSSGGDLDGDKFMVCWDQDIVPSTIAESYTYPSQRERIQSNITRQDLANHFASYSGAGIARIANLHRKWMIATPQGAMSVQCQELNALHSLCVDGGSIKIPTRLENPPEDPAKPFILDLLSVEARSFAEGFSKQRRQMVASLSTSKIPSDPGELLKRLLASDDQAMAFSEDELVGFIMSAWRRGKVDPYEFLPLINWSGVSAQMKHALYATLFINTMEHPYIWNSLVTSDILQPQDLVSRRLNEPLRLQRLYTSRLQGRAAFFEYLDRAMHDYQRKVIILRVDNRLTLGIFIRGTYDEEDSCIGENACVCSFEPTAAHTAATYSPTTKDYRLHYAEGLFQLYKKDKRDTFVFIQRPAKGIPADLNISVALQKIHARVQQIGRVNRLPIPDIEIHVVSQRDREAHQLFDLRFTHVQTEDVLLRMAQERRPWKMNTLRNVNWSDFDGFFQTVFGHSPSVVNSLLLDATDDLLDGLLGFSVKYRAYDHTFAIFRILIACGEEYTPSILRALRQLPGLVYTFLKPRVDGGLLDFPSFMEPPDMMVLLVKCILISANEFGVAAVVALENLAPWLRNLPLADHLQFLWITANSIRATQLCHDILFVLAESRQIGETPSHAEAYAMKQALGICCDRAEEAADSCPCDERGHPTRQRTAPPHVGVFPIENKPFHVRVHVRVDDSSAVRKGSHIRLRATATAENDGLSVDRIIMDGIVENSGRGELHVILFHPTPPEITEIQWLMYHAGITTTSRTMLDAVIALTTQEQDACALHGIITGSDPTGRVPASLADLTQLLDQEGLSAFNMSQQEAIRSTTSPFSLIWGPPGTGKTTVVVKMLERLIASLPDDYKILMTASTHNAVDNVLERFVVLDLVEPDKVVRAATDALKVNKKLQRFTIDAQLGGSPNDNPKLIEKAKKRVAEAKIVFTTCAGAGLGLLRSARFEVVIVDEASQITEPMALIPMVKGCTQAILVGDHVQLRPTVRPLGKALEFDMSLLERLYTSTEIRSPDLSRLMLDIQYRFPEDLCRFPSTEFYDGKLKTGTKWTEVEQERLRNSSIFPWPATQTHIVLPNVFIPCDKPEDYGKSSKGNEGQAELVAYVVKLLLTRPDRGTEAKSAEPLGVTVLTPYSRQVKILKELLPSDVDCSTIDGYQGRENDIIVFSTVRCNPAGDLGFLDDGRRLNVAWTRARFGRIVVGHKETLTKTSELWTRAIKDATEVVVKVKA